MTTISFACGEALRVGGAWLIDMGVAVGADQSLDLDLVAADLAHEIGQNGKAGDNRQFSGVLRAGRERGKREKQQEHAEQVLFRRIVGILSCAMELNPSAKTCVYYNIRQEVDMSARPSPAPLNEMQSRIRDLLARARQAAFGL